MPAARRWLAVAGVALGLAVLVALAYRFERWRVGDQLERVVAAQAIELDRQLAQLALVPRLLADDPRIVGALVEDGDAENGESADAVRVANGVLERARARSGAAFVYLMDATGTTVAASNHDDPLSFVGVNYGYRPYFRGAIAGRETTFFAVGATTGEPGYFIARPVESGARTIGVAVAKVSLDALVDVWREQPHRSLVTDELGVVILSTEPDRLYRAAAPLDGAALARLAADRRYDVVPDRALFLPSLSEGPGGGGFRDVSRLVVSRSLASEPWRLHLVLPGAASLVRATLAAAAVSGVLLIGLLIGRLYRQQRRIAASEQRAARELEGLVASRTAALEAAQRALIAESNFAMLGRMSAAINHEINQPLASLRLDFATLRALTGRDDPPLEAVRQTVLDGDRTTRRIGRVIETLRSVARQGGEAGASGGRAGGEAVTGLDAARLRDEVVATVRRERPDAARALVVRRAGPGDGAPRVAGNAVLLQQALLNLLHNAFDAVAGRESRHVGFALEHGTESDGGADPDLPSAVRFVVEDDGSGVDAAVVERLFEPFASSPSRVGGLGLGLTLARQIAVDHGGTLVHRPRPGGGSVFVLSVPASDVADESPATSSAASSIAPPSASPISPSIDRPGRLPSSGDGEARA